MDKFNEPGYEPEALSSDEFADYCLDLYDDIKFGKRKARKRAAQKLVICATQLEEKLGTAVRKIQSLKNDISRLEVVNRNLSHAIASDTPFKDLPGAVHEGSPRAPSDLATPTIEEARSCVINEHAHGDDAHYPLPPPLEPGTCCGADGRIHDYRHLIPNAGLAAYQGWAHSDPMVNAKVVCQDEEPYDTSKEKAPGSQRGGSPS